MDTNFQKMLSQSKILHTFTQFHMFEFVQKKKKSVAEGNCIILEWINGQNSEPLIFLKMNNFDLCKQITSNIFIKVTYEKSTAYLFFNQFCDNVVYAITTLNKSDYLPVLDSLLLKYANLFDYQSPSLKYQTKIRVDYHCDNVKQSEVIINFNTTAKIGKAIGNFFGKISQKLQKTGQQIDNGFHNKVNKISRQSFSEQTRSSWSKFKESASSFNDKLTELIKPVSTAVGEVATKIGTAVTTSQNTYVKSIRQFTLETQNSINQGYISEVKITEKEKENKNIEKQMNDTYEQINNPKADLKQQMIKGDYSTL